MLRGFFAMKRLESEVQAAITINKIQGATVAEFSDTVNELRAQSEAMRSGNMGQAETMLLAQATTLEALFHSLLFKITDPLSPANEAYFKMALKAQNQCRMTLETLSNIKNPPVVYARQANFANGPQQINNGTHTAETEIQQNKVLEHTHGERLDFGTTAETIHINSKLETLETVNRAKNARRQIKGGS